MNLNCIIWSIFFFYKCNSNVILVEAEISKMSRTIKKKYIYLNNEGLLYFILMIWIIIMYVKCKLLILNNFYFILIDNFSNQRKMENWKKISFFVGVFAFIREFRPIEPFYAAYMTSPLINCTVEQVITHVILLDK
jgi:hypothetical protein